MPRAPLANRNDGPIKWVDIADAPQSHKFIARFLIVMPDLKNEFLSRMARLSAGQISKLRNHRPLIEYVESERLRTTDILIHAQELFPEMSSRGMILLEQCMEDEQAPWGARLKAIEMLLRRDPNQLFPDREKQTELASSATKVHDTKAVQQIQEKGRTMRENALKKLRSDIVEVEVVDDEPEPTPQPEEVIDDE